MNTTTDKLLRFYTHPMSRGRIARWMLEEIGVPYETEILEFGASIKNEAFLAINPMGKVPTIRHGDTVVTEAAAICAYLADAFPQSGLAPPVDARGDYYRWLFFAAAPLEQAVLHKALGVSVPPEKRGMVGYGSYADVMHALEGAVKGRRYIAGDAFSAADVYVGSQIGWGLQFGTIEKRAALETYWNGLKDRPAAVRAREIDDALVASKS